MEEFNLWTVLKKSHLSTALHSSYEKHRSWLIIVLKYNGDLIALLPLNIKNSIAYCTWEIDTFTGLDLTEATQ